MRRVRHSVSSAEYQKLITYTMSDITLMEHNRTKLLRIFGVLYYTGIRLNEISYITIGMLKQIITEQGGVIYTSKTDKERKLYLSENACKKLKQLIKDETNPDAHLAPSWNKATTPMHPIALITLVNDYMKKVLGNGYTSHSFRQGIITEMLSSGVATKVAQEFIGHSSPTTTLRYDKPTEARIRNSLVR
ncbi:MAG: tyrosine-type recombinase/integrase [Sulfurimonas sp.]